MSLTEKQGRKCFEFCTPVEVPALSTAVYRAEDEIPASDAAPNTTLDRLPKETRARFRTAATLPGEKFSGVTFSVRVGAGRELRPAGPDDNAPCRIFYSTSDLEDGEEIPAEAAAGDLSGNTARTGPQTLTSAATHPQGAGRPTVDYGWSREMIQPLLPLSAS